LLQEPVMHMHSYSTHHLGRIRTIVSMEYVQKGMVRTCDSSLLEYSYCIISGSPGPHA
jgi:hypothetical protein